MNHANCKFCRELPCTIEGGAGNDQMYGDTQTVFGGGTVVAGDDNFVFRSDAVGNSDYIYDYNAWDGTNGDTLVLDGYVVGDISTHAFNDGTYQGTQVTLTGGQEIFVVGVADTDLHYDFV
jgi:hypothetical protein